MGSRHAPRAAHLLQEAIAGLQVPRQRVGVAPVLLLGLQRARRLQLRVPPGRGCINSLSAPPA